MSKGVSTHTMSGNAWRSEFRRRYLTRLRQLEASLESYLCFYNHEQTHLGYRTRGRTPASIVVGENER